MPSATKTTVDGENNTASLEIYPSGDPLETTYTWNGTTFVLSERPNDVVLPQADYPSLVADITSWEKLVYRHCQMGEAQFADYNLDVNDRNNRLIFKLKFGDVQAIHSIVRKDSPEIEFKGRPELTLMPQEFFRFRLILKAILPPYHGPHFFTGAHE